MSIFADQGDSRAGPGQSDQKPAEGDQSGDLGGLKRAEKDRTVSTELKLRNVTIVIEPGRTLKFEEFVAEAPPYSIALDGYVEGKTRANDDGPHVNLNHHEEVDRISTNSTCMQAYNYLKAGLEETFKKNGQTTFRIYVNDCDQDTCLAIWLLANHDKFVGSRTSELMEELVKCEDKLDVFGGAFPFSTEERILGKLAWIFEPYTDHRSVIQDMDARTMSAIIEAVCSRITEYSKGEGKEVVPPVGYKNINQVVDNLDENPKGWVFITSEEPYARVVLSKDYTAFVSLVGEKEGTFRYSVGKLKPKAAFPVEDLYDVLNAAEQIKGTEITETNRWGGSDIIGGSPRGTGSKLAPREIIVILNAFLSFRETESKVKADTSTFIKENIPSLIAA